MPSPFVYLYVFPTIPTSPDSGLTSRCGWIAKATPPPPGRRDAMPSQAGGSRVPNIRTALSEACKYGIVHSQMHRFSRRLRRLPLFCKATGKLLAHMIIHGYDRCKLWLRVKRFSTRGIPRDPARRRRMFNRIRQCQEDTLAQHHHKQ